MFVKRGGNDGKILTIIDGDELNEKQKIVKKMSDQAVKIEKSDTNGNQKLEN